MGNALKELAWPRDEYVLSTKIFFGTSREEAGFLSMNSYETSSADCLASPTLAACPRSISSKA